MARCLVTGGAGFIGANLCRQLISDEHDVTVVDNLSSGQWANLGDAAAQARFLQDDVRDASRMAVAMRNVDVVFHLAALPSVARSVSQPWQAHDTNVNGTMTVLLAARDHGVRRVVLASSSSVYGNSPILPRHEKQPPAPLSPYAVSKYVGELYASVFWANYGLETVSLRYFNVFGPGQERRGPYTAVIPSFVLALLRGTTPVIYGDGKQTRDFTYIDNVVAANIKAAFAPATAVAGQVFNVGSGERMALNGLIAEIGRIASVSATPLYEPPRPGDVRDSQADISAARAAIGYEPEVGLIEGLRRTVAWYQSNAGEKSAPDPALR